MSPRDFLLNCDQTFWQNLKEMPDAAQIVDTLNKFAGKVAINILTKSSHNDGCIDGKKKWVAAHFPKLSKNFWSGIGTKAVCASPTSLLIDDYNKNVDEFQAAGGHTILLPRPWNRNYGMNTLEYLEDKLREFDFSV